MTITSLLSLAALLLPGIYQAADVVARPAMIDLEIPVLNYHRFVSDQVEYSTYMKRRLGDFRRDLERLYNAGYSLISLDELIDGNYQLAPGRRPLVLSIDDAYFADQLWLDPETGEPSPQCGIGVLWQFFREFPDFGFKVAMFANYGDKYYGNVYRMGWWYVEDGWEKDLAEAIAWGIEHGVMPYNHLYIHPLLSITRYEHIWEQASLNDQALRDLLALVGRGDLIEQVNNFIALPYGVWPESQAGIDHLIAYTDPEGRPVKAIFEAGYEHMPKYAMPQALSFSPYHIPRMAGIEAAIQAVIEREEK
ncbi:MAG: hypothetical protein AAGU11_04400 [Syntrophobacteraceae bacterium]